MPTNLQGIVYGANSKMTCGDRRATTLAEHDSCQIEVAIRRIDLAHNSTSVATAAARRPRRNIPSLSDLDERTEKAASCQIRSAS